MIDDNRFYTCRNDRAFKEVFMNEKNKDILKVLLESILKVEIREIKYLNLEKNVDNINIRRKHFDLHLDTNIGKIQVEVNAKLEDYTRSRNTAFICDTYSHEVLKGEDYSEDSLIVQINFTYGLGKKEKDLRIYKIQDEEGILYIRNFIIYEFNMDYYKEIWYSKDKKKIEESKYLIMQDLDKKELEILSKKDKVITKYMEELERVNEDPKFREFVSAEQDNKMIENTIKKYARREEKREIAKSLLQKEININIISECTGLSLEEINEL